MLHIYMWMLLAFNLIIIIDKNISVIIDPLRGSVGLNLNKVYDNWTFFFNRLHLMALSSFE